MDQVVTQQIVSGRDKDKAAGTLAMPLIMVGLGSTVLWTGTLAWGLAHLAISGLTFLLS